MMVDFRVHDGFGDHPKTLGLSNEAVGVWTRAGVWCAKHLTDGYIPGPAMDRITTRRRALQELVDHNLLTPLADGWQFIDWMQYQRSKEEVQAELAAAKERMRRLRARRRGDPE